jgi:hypothetical protein
MRHLGKTKTIAAAAVTMKTKTIAAVTMTKTTTATQILTNGAESLNHEHRRSTRNQCILQ